MSQSKEQPISQSDLAPSHRALLLRLLKYLTPYRWGCALTLSCLLLLSLSNTGFLATIKTVTDKGFVSHPGAHDIWLLPLMLFGLLMTRAIAGFGSGYSLRIVGRRVVEDIRVQVFRHMLTLPVSEFDQHGAAYYVSKLTFDCEQLYNAVTKVVASAVRDSLTIVGILGYMLYLDWHLTLLFALVTPLMGVYLKRMSPKLRHSGRSVQESVTDMTQIIEEVVHGQRVVKVFAGADYECKRFAERAGRNRQMMIRLGRISGLNSMVVEGLAALALAMVVFYSVGHFSAGEFAAFISALLMLIGPVKAMTALNEELQIALAACHSVFALLDVPAEFDGGDRILDAPLEDIALRQVSLQYKHSVQPALDKIDVHIRAGEKVALVGLSGGGKSSLVNLLPLFYRATGGQVLLNNQPLERWTLSSVRQQFSVVSQESVLFNDTVMRNIAYGELAYHSEEEVIEAAKAAYAWEFIQRMPHGIHSELGDRGVRLSGGQRQRISIARALLKNAPVLILDEATAALDSHSEAQVQQALERLMQNKTTLIIAHRLSTVRNVDRILVMEAGRIVESGTHAQLLEAKGRYAGLYSAGLQQGTQS